MLAAYDSAGTRAQNESIVCPSFIGLVVDALKSTRDASW